jgi:hypothetical protein
MFGIGIINKKLKKMFEKLKKKKMKKILEKVEVKLN